MRYILLLGMAMMAFGFIKPQFDQGIDQTLHWAQVPYHVLQGSVEVPRSLTVVIKYNKAFKSTPTVILAPIRYDIGDGVPQGFDIQLSAVNQYGFTLTYVALSPQPIFGFDVAWAAILDSNIYTYELQTNNLPTIASNTAGTTRAQLLAVKFPESWTIKTIPNVAIFILGMQCTGAWPKLKVETTTITKIGLIVKVTAGQSGTFSFLRVNMIIGESDTLLTGVLSYTSKSADAINKNSPDSERVNTLSATITDPVFLQTVRYPFYGINNFYYNYGFYGRVLSKNFLLAKEKLSLDLGTWQNSQLMEGGVNWFIYVPKPDATVTNPDCAQVFEACDYQGESFMVCDRKLSFPKDGWNKPVKSFKVPDGKVLKVYNEEDLQGLSIRIEADLACMDVPKFTFLQLVGQATTNGEFWEND